MGRRLLGVAGRLQQRGTMVGGGKQLFLLVLVQTRPVFWTSGIEYCEGLISYSHVFMWMCLRIMRDWKTQLSRGRYPNSTAKGRFSRHAVSETH